jgi:hypothetical protein
MLLFQACNKIETINLKAHMEKVSIKIQSYWKIQNELRKHSNHNLYGHGLF